MRGQAHLIALPALKLAIHLAAYRGYGWFRDEFYYLACSERLALGYVDHPPLSLLILRLVRELLGDSLFAVRLLPALAGAATVLLVGLMARLLGGGRFAQSLAMTAALAAPLYLGAGHIFSMNAFDLLLWALAAYLVLRILSGGSERLWLALGLVLGLGLQNKISVLWLGFGLLVGLLATAERRRLRTAGPWLAGGIAALVFLPHIAWQIAHGWPTLEFIRNATGQKMVDVAFADFAASQVRIMNPVNLPLWLGGLWLFLGRREGARFRLLGWTFVAVFLLLALSGTSRAGYLGPAYTWLLAGGAVLLESWLRPRWTRAAALALVAAGGLVFAPFALPVLPVESYIGYARALGVQPATAERKELAELPQFYADMHGWEEIVGTVAEVYHSLPPAERREAAIFTPNYGDAGAIDLLGRDLGLPRATSGHNNYWLWGPRGHSGEIVIVLGETEEELSQSFEQVELGAVIRCGYCMPYENNRPVWICRGLRAPLAEAWPGLKHFD